MNEVLNNLRRRINFSFLFNPFLLAFWGTLPFLFVIPIKENRFEFSRLDHGIYNAGLIYTYSDLDNDGNSEVLYTFHNSLGSAGLTISDVHGFLNQWNFQGNYNFAQNGFLLTADCDHNDMREVFVFVLSDDSIWLNIIPDFKHYDHTYRRFVSRVGTRPTGSDSYIFGCEQEDLNGDGTDELIFGIGTGFSLQPRNIFAYNIKADTFVISPKSGYNILYMIVEDILGDSSREIIPSGYASDNVGKTPLPYPDSVSWLMVLDKSLNFAFPPVSFPIQFSSLQPVIIQREKEKGRLGALYKPFYNVKDSARFILFDSAGVQTNEIRLKGIPGEILTFRDKKGNIRIIMSDLNGTLDMYDENFSLLKQLEMKSGFQIDMKDIDLDGNEEILCADVFGRRLSVVTRDFNHSTSDVFEGDGERKIHYSIIEKTGEPPLLYMQFGKFFNVYRYSHNPYWWTGYFIYLAIYAGLLILMILSRKIQRDQIRKKQETEKKIVDLQLKLLGNQLDPHFIMNCVNAIVASNTLDEKEKVRSQLMHFAKLHRSMLLQSDRIVISLQEEIDFLKNYLALEKYRYSDRFEYILNVDPAANPDLPVPKMLLQIHSENALKHGILLLEGSGRLEITVSMNSGLRIEIKDNGVGRKANAGRNASTGKGMIMMDQYFKLLKKLNVADLKQEITDLYDSSGNPAGTCVVIWIKYSEN